MYMAYQITCDDDIIYINKYKKSRIDPEFD